MKIFGKFYVLVFALIVNTICAFADTDCSGYKPTYPDHYCECKNDASQLGYLPFDVQVTDSIWFKCSSNLFLEGFTAYLYSDCDVNFDIYQNCTSNKLLYSVVIPKNQARDVTAETIKQKLEEAGFETITMALRICIYPVGGNGGRLMCYPYNTGYNSTCNDILSFLPGMTFVSSQAQNVYELLPENIADSYAMYVQCNEPCQLAITRGSCNGETIAEYNFIDENSLFHFDPALLMDVKAKGESLYAHFSHAESLVPRISLNEVAFVEHLVDTTICQGKEFRYQDFVTTETGVFAYDTVQVSEIEYEVYGYNIVFSELELEYDTIALKASELPYIYRGQYEVDAFGDHDVLIHNDGDCDERVLLHVKPIFTTVVLEQDTTLCKGKRFKYEGKNYVNDCSFVDSVWSKSSDTLFINKLNLFFAPNDVIYDTLALTKKEVGNYQYQGIAINSFGDYTKVVYDEQYCSDTLILHVYHKVMTVEQTVDTTLCAGDVYKHSDGVEYTADVVLVDTAWTDDDTKTITTTNVEFITIALAYDTLYLSYAELPYLYENQAEITQMADTVVSILYGQCFGDVQLHVVHKYETTVAGKDTTLCQGKMYDHNGVLYSEPTTIVDSAWVNQDTFVVTTTHVYFAAPEVQYDTLSVSAMVLPFTYRGEQITDFGEYDLMIKTSGECDEHIMLYVQHLTTTITTEQDTTLCQGRVYDHNGELFSEPATIVDSVWVNQDTLLVAIVNVEFTIPEVEYDSVFVSATDLQNGYYYELADVYIYEAGVYEYEITAENECTRVIYLSVYEHILSSLDDVMVADKPKLIMIDGVIYILHNGEYYTLMGERVGMRNVE